MDTSTVPPDFREYRVNVGDRTFSLHSWKDIDEVAGAIYCDCGGTFKYARCDPLETKVVYICRCKRCRHEIRVTLKQ